MGRKGMDISQLNEVMKRCEEIFAVRYVQPTIHPKFKHVVAITIISTYDTKKLTITNNPDENFDLYVEVNKYLDTLVGNEPIGTVDV